MKCNTSFLCLLTLNEKVQFNMYLILQIYLKFYLWVNVSLKGLKDNESRSKKNSNPLVMTQVAILITVSVLGDFKL